MKEIHEKLNNVHSAFLAIDRTGGSAEPRLYFAMQQLYQSQVALANTIGQLLAMRTATTEGSGPSFGEILGIEQSSLNLYEIPVTPAGTIVKPFSFDPSKPNDPPSTHGTQNGALSDPKPGIGSPEAVKAPEKAEPPPATVAEPEPEPMQLGIGKPVPRGGSQSPGVGKPVQRMRMK